MQINFPFKAPDLSGWRSAKAHYDLCNSNVGGWFPVGVNGFWHSGQHMDTKDPIYAVGPGEIASYRVSNDYIDLNSLKKYPVADKELSVVGCPISDNFVLTKHVLTPPELNPIVFYVLYLHLLPLNPLKETVSTKKKATPVFLQSQFLVKRNGASNTNGLEIRDNGLSTIIGSVPFGAEVFFDNPYDIAENHRLKLADPTNKYHKLIGYEKDGVKSAQSGYVLVDSSTIEVKKRIEIKLDQVVNKSIPIRRGDAIGFPGGNGAVGDDTTVHMEVFIADDQSYDSLKKYTEKQKDELGLKDEELLNLEHYITGQTFASEPATGDSPADKYIDLVPILNKAQFKQVNGKIRIDEVMLKPDSYKNTINKLRRIVVKNSSEWKTIQGIYDRLKSDQGGYYFEKKHSAYEELFQEKMDFWHQLEEKPKVEAAEGEYIDRWRKRAKKFPDEVYFFHPIAFIDHLKKLQNFVKLEYMNEKGKTAKVETIFLVYNEEGELIHRGRFKNGIAYFKKSGLFFNKKYYVWLDERMGSETITYHGRLFRKYEANRFHFHEQLYQYLDIPNWETRWKKDRSLEINGKLGPAGGKNVQRHGPAMNWINRGDILYIPLEEIKVNDINVFEVEEEWETWQSEETLIQISSHAVSTVGPEGGEIKGIAASMTSKVTFSNRKLRKAYELQYHVNVESVSEGLDLNLISGAISEAFGSRRFRKGTPPDEIFESYEGNSYVKEFILPTPVVSVSVGSFKGDKGKDGHFWDGSFITGSFGASIGLYMEVVLFYWNPAKPQYEGHEKYPKPKDISDHVFRSDKY